MNIKQIIKKVFHFTYPFYLGLIAANYHFEGDLGADVTALTIITVLYAISLLDKEQK